MSTQELKEACTAAHSHKTAKEGPLNYLVEYLLNHVHFV